MRLAHLRLVQFRNHRHTALTPASGVTLLVGGNAQGKSSLLEATYLAATGRSPRARYDAEMIALGEPWARVRVVVERVGRVTELDTVLRREEATEPPRAIREIRVNGMPVRRGELFGHLLAVLAAPDDVVVITGPAALRRQMMDLLLAQISRAYYYTAQRYARALRQRNRLLRMRGRGLDAWDDQVTALGAAMTMRRGDLVSRLRAAAGPIYGALSRGQEHLEVEYAPSIQGGDEVAMTAWARQALSRRREEEFTRGMTLVGPHRDNLVLRVDGRDLRTFGSRGQQLTAMLALRLAERRVLVEETGEEPVVLLDDVLLTLDEARQGDLLESLRSVQVLMTATTLATLETLPARAAVYRVRAGTVEMERAHLP